MEGGHHQVLGDSGLGQDGLCGQEEEWNQRCYVIDSNMCPPIMSYYSTILVPVFQALYTV